MSSEYAKAWRSFLHSDTLKNILHEHKFECAFFPHANIQPYLDLFDVPSHIDVIQHDARESIQDVFASARVLLTDYSSVAFEMAYMNRPVIYYQFDREQVFSGGHLTRRGYFDYERDGFGPVCLDESSTLAAIKERLQRNGDNDPLYALRTLTAFKWRDGRCCERVTNAIEGIGRWSAREGSQHEKADYDLLVTTCSCEAGY